MNFQFQDLYFSKITFPEASKAAQKGAEDRHLRFLSANGSL